VPDPFVRLLTAPRWRGAGYTERSKDNPSWEDVEEAVRALDGDERNDVYLEGPGEAMMVIGGGPHHYVISVDVPDDQVGVKHFSAVNPAARPDETIDVVVGGQLSDWPANLIVDLDVALSAARSYYRDGTLAASTQWERV
jgi:hypothetical protein